jgi:hypothetical protein
LRTEAAFSKTGIISQHFHKKAARKCFFNIRGTKKKKYLKTISGPTESTD